MHFVNYRHRRSDDDLPKGRIDDWKLNILRTILGRRDDAVPTFPAATVMLSSRQGGRSFLHL
jgi:hypothetical protein